MNMRYWGWMLLFLSGGLGAVILGELDQQIEQQQAEVAQIRDQESISAAAAIRAAEAGLEQARAAEATANAAVSAAQKEFEQASKLLSEADGYDEGLRHATGKLKSARATLQTELNNVRQRETELVGARRQSQTVTARLDSAQAQLKSLQEQRLEQELADLREQLSRGRTLEVEGVAACGGKIIEQCKEEALTNAKLEAARQGGSTYIEELVDLLRTRGAVEDRRELTQRIQTRLKATLLSHQVLKKGFGPDEATYVYRIQATVKGSPTREDLCLMLGGCEVNDGESGGVPFSSPKTSQPPKALESSTRSVETTKREDEPPPPSELKAYREPLTGMEFVKIDGGRFQMGSPETEKDHQPDEEQHKVSVDSFYLANTEVTNAQYRKYKPDHDSGDYQGKSLNGDDQPVVNVSWEEATAYAEWLSRKAGKKYRLPTEAEWEYAARAGTTTAYHWGNQSSHDKANYGKDDCCDGLAQGKDRWFVTAPVGRFDPNAFGLHDMLGNVWEWTCSAYDKDYGGSEKQCSSKNDAGRRVLRGGSWFDKPRVLRAANRANYGPGGRTGGHGFRLAQDL